MLFSNNFERQFDMNIAMQTYFSGIFAETFYVTTVTEMNFLSIVCPAFSKASETLMLFTEPNSLSPAPTLAAIFTSKALIASATFRASSMIFSL